MCETIELTVKENTEKRLDAYLTEQLSDRTRSFVKNLIIKKHVLLNGGLAKAGAKLREGDRIRVEIPAAEKVEICPQDIPINIIYQDEDIAVIDKPQGMVTHPAAGNPDGTLVNALLFHIRDLSGINGELRPGIVHRLDKDTSGLIVIAKNDAAHEELSRQIGQRTVEKTYTALVYGNVKQENGVIKTCLGRDPRDRKKMAVTPDGREAVTRYRVTKRYGDYTLLEVKIETGRTHQIRVHLKHIGHPVVGDPVYTRKKDSFGLAGQLLHSTRLKLEHPRTHQEMEFYASLPDYFERVLKSLVEI